MLGLISASLAVIQLFVLFYFVEKTQKDLLSFLGSIQYDDFSVKYPTKMHTGFIRKLHEEYNKVITRFRTLRTEKESNFLFYKFVLQQIDIGILAFNYAGDIKISNPTALRLLSTNRLDNLKSIKLSHPEIYVAFTTLLPRQKVVLKLDKLPEKMSISISAIEMMVNGEQIKLLSIQNIQTELEENEMEAWQNMIRVMTHEIMNSLTPITSLAATVTEEMSQWHHIENGEKTILIAETKDLFQAIATIKKRSEGLLHFVDDFRNLSQIPKPKPKLFPLRPFLDHLLTLFKNEFEKHSVETKITVQSDTIQVMADSMLIEQVMINILKNALESFSNIDHVKSIEIRAFYNSESKIEIWVQDNGNGIVAEVLDKVFIPFYSTKKTGSGIGLTISKQIMRSHNGSVKISSEIEKGTLVMLIF